MCTNAREFCFRTGRGARAATAAIGNGARLLEQSRENACYERVPRLKNAFKSKLDYNSRDFFARMEPEWGKRSVEQWAGSLAGIAARATPGAWSQTGDQRTEIIAMRNLDAARYPFRRRPRGRMVRTAMTSCVTCPDSPN